MESEMKQIEIYRQQRQTQPSLRQGEEDFGE